MLGAIVGDIVGSIYEFNNYRSKDFPLFSPNCFFTDDTVMSLAVAKALMECKGNYNKLSKLTIKCLKEFGEIYPNLSYGNSFIGWLNSRNPQPYNSCGNGSAMRVSAVSYFAKDVEEVKKLSRLVTEVTHNHIEGIKGAEATAVAVFLARQGKSKSEIKNVISYYYDLEFNYEDLKENYVFNELAQTTVPQAIYCFLISESFEDAIRTAISIGGDSDTLCAITGAIAEAYYTIDEKIKLRTLSYLDERLLKLYNDFEKVVNIKK